jgi:hypothetical protein
MIHLVGDGVCWCEYLVKSCLSLVTVPSLTLLAFCSTAPRGTETERWNWLFSECFNNVDSIVAGLFKFGVGCLWIGCQVICVIYKATKGIDEHFFIDLIIFKDLRRKISTLHSDCLIYRIGENLLYAVPPCTACRCVFLLQFGIYFFVDSISFVTLQVSCLVCVLMQK